MIVVEPKEVVKLFKFSARKDGVHYTIHMTEKGSSDWGYLSEHIAEYLCMPIREYQNMMKRETKNHMVFPIIGSSKGEENICYQTKEDCNKAISFLKSYIKENLCSETENNFLFKFTNKNFSGYTHQFIAS